MKLQTEIKIKKQVNNPIDYYSKLLLLGSCFSENISSKFNYFKFQAVSNPFGILFHPQAIENLVLNALNNKVYSEADVFFNNEQWHCFEGHSKLSNNSKESLIKVLNTSVKETKQALEKTSHIVITLGTAWVYQDIKTGKSVANCHKVSQKKFNKTLLLVENIAESLQSMVEAIKSINKKVSIIFTVSPVRHIKDGFVENTQSKSHLITAIHQLVNSNEELSYFPSYEIMMDELRDYRFYKQDMLHPNDTAINYIWEKFKNVWISNNAMKTMNQVDIIQKGLLHRPFNINSEAHKIFLKNLNLKVEILQQKHPGILF